MTSCDGDNVPDGGIGNAEDFGDPAVALVVVSHFEVPPSIDEERAGAHIARFATLFIDPFDDERVGGSGMVVPAYDGDGNKLALKRLLLPDRGTFPSDEAYAEKCARRRQAFREEFELLSYLAGFSQFPDAYGYGEVDGVPAILMEWVEGLSFERLLKMSGGGRRTGFPANDVAVIGRSLFQVLKILQERGTGFVHRDLSPANIIWRVYYEEIDPQIDSGELDLCLIDFGSSLIDADAMAASSSSANPVLSALRGTTPEYAPPEMLPKETGNAAELRNSPKVDVYAACSVLHELLWGETPFGLYEQEGLEDMAGFKVAHEPQGDPEPTKSLSMVLDYALNRGLAASQEDRPAADVMYEACDRFIRMYKMFEQVIPPEEGLRWEPGDDEFDVEIDPIVLFPKGSVSVGRPPIDNGFMNAVWKWLDFGVGYGERQQDISEEGVGSRIAWWLQRHFTPAMAVMFIVFSVLMVYVGHSWHVLLAS